MLRGSVFQKYPSLKVYSSAYQKIRVRVRVLTDFVLELSELVVVSRANRTRIVENKKEGEVESIIFLVHITAILHIIFFSNFQNYNKISNL